MNPACRNCMYLVAALAFAPRAAAQEGVASAVQTVTLTAVKPATASVLVVGGGTQSLPGELRAGAVNDFPVPVSLSTAWNVDPTVTAALTVVAYFDAPAQALRSGDAAIPASRVAGRVASGAPTSFTPFTQGAVVAGDASAGTAGGTLVLFTVGITPGNAIGAREDELELRLDLTDVPAIPAGTYVGTLNIRAITQ